MHELLSIAILIKDWIAINCLKQIGGLIYALFNRTAGYYENAC